MERSSDQKLLLKEDKRLLITRDKGFGALTFLGESKVWGVILLRIKPENQDKVRSELRRVPETLDQLELQTSFCTIEPGRHRIRRIHPM